MYRFPTLISFIGIICSVAFCEVYRLPDDVKPIRYTLTLEPDLESNLRKIPYNGSVTIELQVLKNTKNITLHKKYLQIDDSAIRVTDSNGTEFKVLKTFEDKHNEIFTINLDSELLEGENYNLTIAEFTNNLSPKEKGFYAGKYWTKDDKQRVFAMTKFEPSYARWTFPCFDEPGIKSKFIINLIRSKGYNSASNQELETTVDLGDGKFQDTFKETPIMPVHAVAFMISDYKLREQMDRHRIFGKANSIDYDFDFDYTSSLSVKILKAFEEYTGIQYMLNKMDQFAVPDFYTIDTAVERLGLITLGQSILVHTNASASEDLVTSVQSVAHEIAHQWFGGLVTPSWWKYVWLSERPATYFEYYIPSIIEPTWKFMDLFVINNMHLGMEWEVEDNTSALNYDITSIGELPPDETIYLKGASTIRMMAHCLTEDVFKRGIQLYLQNGKFSTAQPSDLYSAWQQAVDGEGLNGLLGNHTVSDIMKSWDSNDMFPLLTVTRDYTDGSVRFNQESFTQPNDAKTWIIPITYVPSSNQSDFSDTTADFWLSQRHVTLNNSFSTDGWLIVNKQQMGYYRVNYDDENWERIISFLNSENYSTIHPLNRAQLIDDAFNLAKHNYIPYDIPLRLCDYLVREKEYAPFDAFYRGVYDLKVNPLEENSTESEIQYFENYTLKNQLVLDSNQHEIYKEYVAITLGGLLNYLGFADKESDNLLDKLNRGQLVNMLCHIQHPECVKFTSEKLEELLKTNATYISPDVEEFVLCKGMRNATKEEFRALHLFYNSSADLHQKYRLCSALNCAEFYSDGVCQYYP